MSELGRNSFLNAAKLSSEQVQQMNDSQLESLTSSAKDVYLVANVKQVEKIESKLEKLEAKKASELEKHRSKKPGRFAPKDQKKEWETKDKKLKSELNSIQLKKSVVQTIKESMYEGSPRIEYLAEKKMKFFESDLNGIIDARDMAKRLSNAQSKTMTNEVSIFNSHENTQGQVNTRSRSRSLANDD